MLELDELKISIHQGDTGTIGVTFTGNDIPEDGTIAKVSMQKTLDSEEPLWSKYLEIEDGSVTIPLFTEDSDYAYGTYFWCLRLLYADGDVYTPMKPQKFVILPAVGDASRESDSDEEDSDDSG